MSDVFTILKPDEPLPLVFDSPHSGTLYPDDFNYACDFATLCKSEDHFVDDLFASAPHHKAALLMAHFPRSYIDPNRAECDIDSELIHEDWPGEANPTARSNAGIGLIRRLVKPGVPVYNRTLNTQEVRHRIDAYYRPYHTALKELLDEAHYNFGQVWHINCHSMPSSTAHPRQAIGIIGRKSKSVDFCLGDRDGTTCNKDFTHALRDFIKAQGYTVGINDPFKGVELVSRYAAPNQGRHSLQLEINKALYMNEETGEKRSDYAAFKTNINALITFCANHTQSNLTQLAAD